MGSIMRDDFAEQTEQAKPLICEPLFIRAAIQQGEVKLVARIAQFTWCRPERATGQDISARPNLKRARIAGRNECAIDNSLRPGSEAHGLRMGWGGLISHEQSSGRRLVSENNAQGYLVRGSEVRQIWARHIKLVMKCSVIPTSPPTSVPLMRMN